MFKRCYLRFYSTQIILKFFYPGITLFYPGITHVFLKLFNFNLVVFKAVSSGKSSSIIFPELKCEQKKKMCISFLYWSKCKMKNMAK